MWAPDSPLPSCPSTALLNISSTSKNSSGEAPSVPFSSSLGTSSVTTDGTALGSEKSTSALNPLGNWSFASHRTSTSSRINIKTFERINVVWNMTLNIISSLTRSSSKWTHSRTTSPWTRQWMSIFTIEHSSCW